VTPSRPELRVPLARPSAEEAAAVRARARRRIRLVGGLLAGLMFLVEARGVQLALDPDPQTLEIATAKRWASVTTQGERGTILDHDGNVLATSVKHPAVFLDPRAVREWAEGPANPTKRTPEDIDRRIGEVARKIAEILDRPYDEVRTLCDARGRYLRLAKGVHPEVADALKDAGLLRRGLIVEENYRRFYPQGAFAAQLVGFVDDSGAGQQGLEAWFDSLLEGAEVTAQHPVNRWGRVLELWHRDDKSAQGRTIHTTIDRVVQRSLESALAQVMVDSAPVSATAVVVEVKTGRILAIATAPSFNPNDVSSLRQEDYARTQNLAVTAAIEPGSVFKPFTLAAGLEAGVVTLDTMLATSSPYIVYNARIRDDHPHAAITVAEMVKYSSNIGAAKVAQMVATKHGGDWLLDVYKRFGFGERSGIDTQGEARGQRRPYGNFGPVELATVSFGQGLTTSALQLGFATAAIANGGVRMQPILVDRVTDAYGRDVRTWEPTVAARVVSEDTARKVTRAMEMVIEEGGTGTRAAIDGYKVAGKTGTAQKPKGGVYSAARRSTFIGFAPSDRPEVAMAIIVDEPTIGSRYGGIVAAPAFSTVVGAALRHRGVPVDPALVKPKKAPQEPSSDDGVVAHDVELLWDGAAWTLPDLRGRSVRDVLAALQGTGLRLDVGGTGLLDSQDPPPGGRVRPGETLRLRFD
jgi:cell division protein FtsI (penicillin-binding protein 3)